MYHAAQNKSKRGGIKIIFLQVYYPRFIALIEVCQYIKLNRSFELQFIFANSEGYPEYCSHILFNSRFFQYSKLANVQNIYTEVLEESINPFLHFI